MNEPHNPFKGKINILIVNVHSICNAGDAALLQMNIAQLRSAFPESEFAISTNYPLEDLRPLLEGIHFTIVHSPFTLIGANGEKPIHLQILNLIGGLITALSARIFPQIIGTTKTSGGWKQFIAAYQKASIVVGVSGNQFLSLGRYGWPLPVTAFSVYLAILFRKPLYLLPQSIGPFKRRWDRNLTSYLFRRARLVFLRDNISLETAKEIRIPAEKTRFSPDPAFCTAAATEEKALEILNKYGFNASEPSLGLTVIAPLTRAIKQTTFETYYACMSEVVDQFIAHSGGKVFVFPQVVGPTEREDDRVAAQRILKTLKSSKEQVRIIKEPLPPDLLKACYGCMDIFIASRLHSGIFSLGQGVPTLFIGYMSKSRGVLQSLGLEEWVIDIDQIQVDAVWLKLTKMLANTEQIHEQIIKKLDQVTPSIWEIGNLILEDYMNAKN